jgi:hypothetical protein
MQSNENGNAAGILGERTRVRLRVLAVGICALALLAPSPALASSGARAAVPNPGTGNVLTGVACALASRCFAVGYYNNGSFAQLNQALRWNGKQWSVTSTPQPGGTTTSDRGSLAAVACPATNDCWAVGSYQDPNTGAGLNQILHWNGHKWSKTATPQPGETIAGFLRGLSAVTCTSTHDCWAVGLFTGKGFQFLNQTLHYNGKKWSQVKAPNPGGHAKTAFNQLDGVGCAAVSDCLAVGSIETSAYKNQALRWNGTKWAQVRTPQPGGSAGSVLTGDTCATATFCFAVGDFGQGNAQLNQTLRWNGNKWASVPAPNPAGNGFGDNNQLNGVSCASKTNCWAVGYSTANVAPTLNEALRWNGKQWAAKSTPQPGGTSTGTDLNELNGVTCLTRSDCWAVGFYQPGGPRLNQVLHYDGHSWSTG